MIATQRKRTLGYQAGYAAASGLCLVDPYVSIGALVLLQLHSVVAPPRPRLPQLPRRWGAA